MKYKKSIVFIGILTILFLLIGCNSNDKANYYDITINKTGSGTVIKDPAQDQYEENTTVDLKAVADENWKFGFWEGSGYEANPKNEINLVINNNLNLNAKFGKNIFTDNFSNSSNNWYLHSYDSTIEELNYLENSIELKLKNLMKNKEGEKVTTMSIASPENDIITTDDFLVTLEYKKVSEDGAIAIYLGDAKIEEELYVVQINSKPKEYSIYHQIVGEYPEEIEKGSSEKINSTQKNILVIKKINDELKVYINDNHLVTKSIDGTVTKSVKIENIAWPGIELPVTNHIYNIEVLELP